MVALLEKFFGLQVSKALELASSSGLKVRLVENKPPAKSSGLGLKRVILPRLLPAGELELIWSYERYQ